MSMWRSQTSKRSTSTTKRDKPLMTALAGTGDAPMTDATSRSVNLETPPLTAFYSAYSDTMRALTDAAIEQHGRAVIIAANQRP
jgi:hypothetical protein